jgi:hypothetical protein
LTQLTFRYKQIYYTQYIIQLGNSLPAWVALLTSMTSSEWILFRTESLDLSQAINLNSPWIWKVLNILRLLYWTRLVRVTMTLANIFESLV